MQLSCITWKYAELLGYKQRVFKEPRSPRNTGSGGCHFSFAEGELVRISVKDTLEGNVPQTRAVNVCKDCYDSWKIDSSVFETFYRNAVSSVLFKTKGDFLSETSCSAL